MRASCRTGKVDVSDIVQFLYCPRKVYFIKVAGIRILKPKMEEGRRVQEEVAGKMRKLAERFNAKLLSNVYLESEKFSLAGVLDFVLLSNDEAIPVDVKFSRFSSISYAWKMQVTAYAILIEENLGKAVKKAYIFLVGEKERLMEVLIASEDKKALERIVEKVRELIETEEYPKAAKSKRCGYCEVAKFCV